MKIIDKFTEEQLNTLKSINIVLDNSDYSDDEIINIDTQIAESMMLMGFDGDDINLLGSELESILDVFAEL